MFSPVACCNPFDCTDRAPHPANAYLVWRTNDYGPSWAMSLRLSTRLRASELPVLASAALSIAEARENAGDPSKEGKVLLSQLRASAELSVALSREATDQLQDETSPAIKDEYTDMLEVAARYTSMHKRSKKLRRALREMPQDHPSRSQAHMMLYQALVDLGGDTADWTEAFDHVTAARTAAAEGSLLWAKATVCMWHTGRFVSQLPEWWHAAELRRLSSCCCRRLKSNSAAWLMQAEVLSQNRIEGKSRFPIDHFHTPAELRAASACYLKAMMLSDGWSPDPNSHIGGLAAKFKRNATEMVEMAETIDRYLLERPDDPELTELMAKAGRDALPGQPLVLKTSLSRTVTAQEAAPASDEASPASM